MDILSEALAQGLPARFDTVLHIGAGVNAFEVHERIAARRRILVEGDPNVAADLRSNTRFRHDPANEIWEEIAAAEGGEILWRQQTVRWLNGPLPVEGLSGVYPRLRQYGQSMRPATAIQDLVTRALADDDPAQASNHLLVLDVPGQEAALLRYMAPQALSRFSWIVLRGGQQPYGLGWSTARDAETLLASRHFRRSALTPERTGLWQTLALARDDEALSRARERAAQAQLEARCVESERELAACVAARDSARREASDREQQLISLSTQLEQVERDVATRVQAFESRQRELEQQLAESGSTLTAQLNELEGARAARQATALELMALTQTLDSLRAAAVEREELQRQTDAMHAAAIAETTRLAGELSAVRRDLAQATELAAQAGDQRATAEAANTALRATYDDLQKRCEWRGQQLQQLKLELAEAQQQQKAGQEAGQEALQLAQSATAEAEARAASADQATSECHRQLAALRDRLHEVEGQWTGRGEELQQLQGELDRLRADLERCEQEKLAAQSDFEARRTEQEQLLAKLQDSKRELESKWVWRGEQMKLLQGEVEQLRAENAQLEVRASTAEVETAAAQAQLERNAHELSGFEAAKATHAEELTQLHKRIQEIEGKSTWRGDQIKLLQQEIEGLRSAAATLEQRAATAAAETEAARAALARSEQDAKARQSTLEDEISQLQLRQRLLDEEMIKAEGQLDLIKDVLLREPGL